MYAFARQFTVMPCAAPSGRRREVPPRRHETLHRGTRRTPAEVTTDQKVGGSSPSERAGEVQVRGPAENGGAFFVGARCPRSVHGCEKDLRRAGSVEAAEDSGRHVVVPDRPRRRAGRSSPPAPAGRLPDEAGAQTALNEALGELQRGEFVSPSKQTLAEYTEAWLAAVKGELAESAWANYGALMPAYVLPRVGAVRLVDLTPQRVQALYVELLERGKKDGSSLSARSVLQVHRTLHRALGDAVRWRLLAGNPAHGVRPPRAGPDPV